MISLDLGTLQKADTPFPHIVVDNVLPSEFYAALDASYPQCPVASGPTGYTIHAGDELFETVITGNSAWRELYAYCCSRPFLDQMIVLFESEIERSCLVCADDFYQVDHIESRADKERKATSSPQYPAEAVFTRFDFMQGKNSYARAPHLDHRRRLATMLVYFDAPGPDTHQGGDLILHDASGSAVTHVPPAANRAVLFPCSERSWHSVSSVYNCRRPRRFVQVALSSERDLWPDAQLPVTRLAKAKRAIRAILPVAS